MQHKGYKDGRWLNRSVDGRRNSGSGILSDDYSEESCGPKRKRSSTLCRFPNDGVDPTTLNGPCVIVQPGRKKDEAGNP